MGLLDFVKKVKKPKAERSVVSRENEVLGALRKTLGKAKVYDGDPFYKYRKEKILPENFEYGMNCFLDRIFESDGAEVVQKTYEELKKMGGCRLTEEAFLVDIAGLPVLFGVKPSMTLAAINKAISILRKEKERVLSDKLRENLSRDDAIFFKRLEDETEYEYVLRLTVVSMGLMRKSLDLLSQGNLSLSERLTLYSKIIDEITPTCEQELSSEETDILLFTAGTIGKIIPEEEVELFEFFSMIGPYFWNTLWLGFLKHFHSYYSNNAINAIVLVDSFFRSFEKKNMEQIEGWKEKSPKLNVSSEQNIVWEEIKNRVDKITKYLPRDISLIVSVRVFFTVFGYRGGLSEVIPIADKSILKFLFNKLATETTVDYTKKECESDPE